MAPLCKNKGMETTRRILAISVIVLLISFTGCKALKKLTQIYLDYKYTITYPANLPVGVPLTIASPEIETNIEQELEKAGSSTKMIESVKLNMLRVTLTEPQGQDFSFLQSMEVYLSAPGYEEIRVAHKENIPASSTQLLLEVDNVELKEYLKSDKITLRIAGRQDEILVRDINTEIYAKFFVDAKILGL
jgi:hypothetical protein